MVINLSKWSQSNLSWKYAVKKESHVAVQFNELMNLMNFMSINEWEQVHKEIKKKM